MKNIFLALLFALYALNSSGQFEYDYIDRNEFSILKRGLDKGDFSSPKVSQLKNKKDAEKQFGKNYKQKLQLYETKNINYDCLEYDDGLILSLPEDEHLFPEFLIKSNKYFIQLNNGKTIQVGMKAQELKEFFPKSFEKRYTYKQTKGRKGKIRVAVYFSSIIDGEKQIEDSMLIFILNSDDGTVEEFYTWEPS